MAENIVFSCALLILKEIDSESDSSSDEEWELLRKTETQLTFSNKRCRTCYWTLYGWRI